MNKEQTSKFIIIGILAFFISLIPFHITQVCGGNHIIATYSRWLILIPFLYWGYSRVVLKDTLASEKKTIGRLKAEAYMGLRIFSSIGASVLIKLILEPVIANSLSENGNYSLLFISPIIADFGYGPLANYFTLTILTKIKPNEVASKKKS